jgi:hypothetical protein
MSLRYLIDKIELFERAFTLIKLEINSNQFSKDLKSILMKLDIPAIQDIVDYMLIDKNGNEKKFIKYIEDKFIVNNQETYSLLLRIIDDEKIEFNDSMTDRGAVILSLVTQFQDVIEIVNNLSSQSTSQKQKVGYIWQSNPEKELLELYNLMIDKYKLIAPETTYDQFKAVFTGQPIDDIEPIRWHQDNASELLYFIDRLEQSNNIIYNPNRADYQKLKACFVKPDGKPFNVVWKSLKTNLEINLSSDKQKAIDELLKNF